MKRILIVKLTSLGDMVFTLPVVTDLLRAYPGVRIDWVADDYCAAVPRWNPNVERVIAPPLRRFKKTRSWADLRQIFGALRELRREKYDVVIDLHGVYKSAIVSFLARAKKRYGYPVAELGEAGARFAYSDLFPPHRESDCARERMRYAASQGLGYKIRAEREYGLRLPPGVPAEATRGPYAMIFHATSADTKKWPQQDWTAVGRMLSARGLRVLLPWGSDKERGEAEAIAAGIPTAEVMPRMSITECTQMIERATLVAGTDTGLVHIAEALGRPTVMLFTETSQFLYGVNVPGRAVALGGDGVVPRLEEVLAAVESVLPGQAAQARLA